MLLQHQSRGAIVKDIQTLRSMHASRGWAVSRPPRASTAGPVAGLADDRRPGGGPGRAVAVADHPRRGPTEAGLEFLARIEPILAALEDAENSVRETGELRGLLRIAMPSTMGIRVIIPRLSIFAERIPTCTIDLVLDDRWQDMVRDAVDVGIRVGRHARRFGNGQADRDHAPDAGRLARLCRAARRARDAGDLVRHRIVGGPAAAQASSWRFQRGGQA
jgi:DNA-binding transcriptional LysR family regulator